MRVEENTSWGLTMVTQTATMGRTDCFSMVTDSKHGDTDSNHGAY